MVVMVRRCLSALVLLVVLGVAAPAGGAPNKGATWGNMSVSAASAWVFVDAPGCAGFPSIESTPQDSPALTAEIKGWYGPATVDEWGMPLSEPVQLHAHVSGSLTDVHGSPYHVVGNFSENDTISLLVPPFNARAFFNGSGSAVLSGPAGTVEGAAGFGYIGDFPVTFVLRITDVRACNLK